MIMLQSERPDLKRGIGETESEAVTHRDAVGVKISISHIEVFRINFMVHIVVVMGKILCVRVILIVHRPAVGQFARRVDLSRQHIRNRISRLHSGLVNVENRIQIFDFVCDV